MRSDAELLEVPAEHFPFDMTDAEQERWLEIAPDADRRAAREAAEMMGHRRATERATKAIDRGIDERMLMAAQAAVPAVPTPKWKKVAGWTLPWLIPSLIAILIYFLSRDTQ